ncbi:hypothetical protein [Pseudanabaena sp. UWO310]|uniref:hypothetical protein n=1 Tax=Pseudanabaena sp. UWO310 TaxID=2480795 RepID=UPI00168028DD|nr:hypothetical protein [Pseudanabaena sp. UWO310]
MATRREGWREAPTFSSWVLIALRSLVLIFNIQYKTLKPAAQAQLAPQVLDLDFT